MDPHRSAHVITNLTGTAHGRILTGPAVDTHNTFEAPDAIHPVTFAATNGGDKVAFVPSRCVIKNVTRRGRCLT
jgi:alpha-N-arabinofuranosidase